MATIVNWSREEVYKLISLWSDDVIQEQLEGCRRNSQVYKKIADSLREAGFNRTFEQCREKMKKLRGEYKKVKDKRNETGQGRFPEWEFYDAMDAVMGHKHSTEPPVVIESMPSTSSTEIDPDEETQDMSGAVDLDVNEPSQMSSSSSTSQNSSNTVAISEAQQSNGKLNKRKRSKNEVTNSLLERMVRLHENSDKMMYMLEEKRTKMEERQIELDAQLRREERDFQLQIMQIMMRQSNPHHPPPPSVSNYPMHSSFSFGSAEFDLDPDATPNGL